MICFEKITEEGVMKAKVIEKSLSVIESVGRELVENIRRSEGKLFYFMSLSFPIDLCFMTMSKISVKKWCFFTSPPSPERVQYICDTGLKIFLRKQR